LIKNFKLKIKNSAKTFLAVSFGCRVNAAETNQLSQFLLSQKLTPTTNTPDLVIINTCSVTAKANIESLGKIRSLRRQYPHALIIVTGCADTKNIKTLKNIIFLSNSAKEKLLKPLHSSYSPKIKDKFSHTHRFILKIQSGCNHFCSYCIVPYRRPTVWSLPINSAIKTVNQAITDGYREIIITGTNLELYQPGLSNLLEALLTKTKIPLISFGSLPLNCIDDKFLSLITDYRLQFTNYFHVPTQSGSNKILKLMNRPYDNLKIKKLIENCKLKIENLSLGTDIILGFPGETDADFQETYDLCQKIGFSKIHLFKFSPRPGTAAAKLALQYPRISPSVLSSRRHQLLSTISK